MVSNMNAQSDGLATGGNERLDLTRDMMINEPFSS
jgi:hypothetical protein